MDLKSAKLQYEVFGKDVQEVARTHNVSPKMLQKAIKDQGWVRLPIATGLEDWTRLDPHESGGQEALEVVQEKLAVLQAVRQYELGPKYIECEMLLLTRISELILSSEDVTDIKELAAILTELRPASHDAASNGKNGSGDGLKIMVVNQFGDHPPDPTASIVSDSAVSMGGGERGL